MIIPSSGNRVEFATPTITSLLEGPDANPSHQYVPSGVQRALFATDKYPLVATTVYKSTYICTNHYDAVYESNYMT